MVQPVNTLQTQSKEELSQQTHYIDNRKGLHIITV